MDGTPACRAQIGDAGGESGKCVQRIAEFVQRERLDMELQIRRLILRRGAGEGAELRGRHGQGPAPRQRIGERHAGALHEGAVIHVHGAHAVDLEYTAQLQMVLQIFADARKVMQDRYAKRL